MFAKGEPVVHPKYGAGILQKIGPRVTSGVKQRFFTISLINGEGTLMIPVRRVKETGLRHAVENLDTMILEVLADEPNELASNYRTRQANIIKKIDSGVPKQIAEALRDLTWYGYNTKLSQVDTKLKAQAEEMLAGELAVTLGLDIEKAIQRLKTSVQRHIQAHAMSEIEAHKQVVLDQTQSERIP
jgi:CarD family transcriptional regulator